jgi:hypothetical protein
MPLDLRCAQLDAAVVYVNWRRCLHTFQFYNEDYAAAFMSSNERKIVVTDPS